MCIRDSSGCVSIQLFRIHGIADPLLIARACGYDFDRDDFPLVVVMKPDDFGFNFWVQVLGCLDVADPLGRGLRL